jgi:hypothetical protein
MENNKSKSLNNENYRKIINKNLHRKVKIEDN